MPLIAPTTWRSGKFVCSECGAAFRAWVDRLHPVILLVGEHVMERCPKCRRATYFELVEIVEVPIPPRYDFPFDVSN